MSTTEKKVPSIGQLLAVYFHTTDPGKHADILLLSWVGVLSNLDHSQSEHMPISSIQQISSFIMDYKAMTEDQRVPLEKAAN